MNKFEYTGRWEGYGLLTYTDLRERDARKMQNASMDFSLEKSGGLTFVTEPVNEIALIVCKVMTGDLYTGILYKSDIGQWKEAIFSNDHIDNLNIYEI
jgi:hypothetical protein